MSDSTNMAGTAGITSTALATWDAVGVDALSALTHVGSAIVGGVTINSLANPNKYVCTDGKTYWAKATAQHGLVAELVAGRLASALDAGPNARVIDIDPAISGTNQQLVGRVVGIEDKPGTVNWKELGHLAPGDLDASLIKADSRARVTAFQSWIGVGDAQVLIRLTDGAVFSIDHGDCFGNVSAQTPINVIHVSIPGVPDAVGRTAHLLSAAVTRIESISDDFLVQAVSRVPDGGQWGCDPARRLAIAGWLRYRRDHLREVIEPWALN